MWCLDCNGNDDRCVLGRPNGCGSGSAHRRVRVKTPNKALSKHRHALRADRRRGARRRRGSVRLCSVGLGRVRGAVRVVVGAAVRVAEAACLQIMCCEDRTVAAPDAGSGARTRRGRLAGGGSGPIANGSTRYAPWEMFVAM